MRQRSLGGMLVSEIDEEISEEVIAIGRDAVLQNNNVQMLVDFSRLDRA